MIRKINDDDNNNGDDNNDNNYHCCISHYDYSHHRFHYLCWAALNAQDW